MVRLVLMTTILTVLLISSGGGGEAQLAEPPKKLVVCPEGPPACQFDKIEVAVQAAGPNDLIFLRPGTYQETLVLEKSVRIVAAEPGQVRIQGQEPGKPTITLKTQEDLRVALEGVTILGGPSFTPSQVCFDSLRSICPTGIVLSGEGSLTLTLVDSQITQAPGGLLCPWTLHSSGTARLILLNSRFSETGDGIWLDGCDFREVSLTLQEVTFTDNGANGILIDQRYSNIITVTIDRSRFVANGVGLNAIVGGREVTSNLTIRDTWFLNNVYGARLPVYRGSTTEIRASRFISNRWGLDLLGERLGPLRNETEGFVLLEDSVFTDNIERGLYVMTSSRVEARSNIIQSNGTGILVRRADTVLSLEGNRITDNREWGIALVRSPCVENPPSDPRFIWPIYIQGENNEIHGNGKGDLCPEDYNWPPDFIKKP